MANGAMEFEVHIEDEDGVRVIRPSGKADEVRLEPFERALNEAVSDGGAVIDLSELEYLCSWGFGMMVEKADTVSQKGGKLVFLRPTTRLFKLFQILCIDQLLTFADDMDEAVAFMESAETTEQ